MFWRSHPYHFLCLYRSPLSIYSLTVSIEGFPFYFQPNFEGILLRPSWSFWFHLLTSKPISISEIVGQANSLRVNRGFVCVVPLQRLLNFRASIAFQSFIYLYLLFGYGMCLYSFSVFCFSRLFLSHPLFPWKIRFAFMPLLFCRDIFDKFATVGQDHTLNNTSALVWRLSELYWSSPDLSISAYLPVSTLSSCCSPSCGGFFFFSCPPRPATSSRRRRLQTHPFISSGSFGPCKLSSIERNFHCLF
jgi:hypothetical protein